MRVRITRRELAASLAASVAAAPAQTVPEEPLDQARVAARRDVEQLRSYPLPMTAEPAFLFKA